MKKTREKTLPEILGEYAKRNTARFHMPGHKGFGIPMAESLSGWDITELPETDNLHMPNGVIKKTQDSYAQAYGARDCFLLINGSTAGVLAMLLAIGQNKRVLLARNCHRSAVSGIALAGHELDFIFPTEEGVVCSEDIDAALALHPADAVMIVSPDPYGRCSDIKAVAEAAHRHGALLLLDAAHGAHFPFAESLPELYPECVDMFCVSAHKTLNSFTQSALLFTGLNCPIEAAHIQKILSLVQSTSPSYPMMASLDWALHTARGWEEHVARMLIQQKRLATANGVNVQTLASLGSKSRVFALDPTRIVIDVSERGITGQEAYADLYRRDVAAEMADSRRVVFITTPNDPADWFERLYETVCTLPYGICLPDIPFKAPPSPASPVIPVRDAILAPSSGIELENAAGRISANAVGIYPPGVAVIYPGEKITGEIIHYLEAAIKDGGTIFGLEENGILRVVQ